MASAETFPDAPSGVVEDEQPSRLEGFFWRLGVTALVLLGPAAVLYLAFNRGGYFPNTTSFAAIIFAQALVLRTVLSEHPFAGYNWRLAIPLIALALFAAEQLASALWSHDTARALDEYVRTLLYLLAFALVGSLPRTWLRLQWLVRALAVALTAVCLAGLISRLLPHLWPTSPESDAERLAYPLTYWNALGMTAAMATTLLVHLSSSLRERRPVRILAALFAPATATTLLLTYSRGAIVVAVIGLLVYAIVGRPHGLLSAVVAIVPVSAIALHSAYDATLISSYDPASPAAVVQGHHVAVTVGISMLVATAVRAALCLLLDPWLAVSHRLPERFAGVPRWARWAAPAAIAVVVLLAVGTPGYASRQISHFLHTNAGPRATQTRERLISSASNGRVGLWRVAEHQFQAHPLLGGGAGTYELYFDQHRSEPGKVVDAHSLYLQTLGEQGIFGLALLLVVLLAILITLAVRCRGSQRSLYAALLAVCLAWAVHVAADWDWQMPAVTIVVFVIGSAALASSDTERTVSTRPRNATVIALCFLALAVAPLFVGISYQRLESAGAALKAGNCATAKRQALSSISVLAVRPEAYEIIGFCDLRQGFPTEALEALKKAEAYEPKNWNYHYGLAIGLAANELDPSREARRALQLNPKEPLVIDEMRTFHGSSPVRWQSLASKLLREGIKSGALSVSTL